MDLVVDAAGVVAVDSEEEEEGDEVVTEVAVASKQTASYDHLVQDDARHLTAQQYGALHTHSVMIPYVVDATISVVPNGLTGDLMPGKVLCMGIGV